MFFAIPNPSKLISKLCKGYLGYVWLTSQFRNVRRVKLIAFKHQFAYNLPESDLKLEIGIESNCSVVRLDTDSLKCLISI